MTAAESAGAALQRGRGATVTSALRHGCLLALTILAVRTFVIRSYAIPSDSMLPTLLAGDTVIVNRLIDAEAGTRGLPLLLDPVRRGDIVVFSHPEKPSVDLVKRVVAVAGDRVDIRNKRVFLNDALVPEPYVRYDFPPDGDEAYARAAAPEFGPRFIPRGHYFVLGDNRDTSYDSRYFGAVAGTSIKGKVIGIYGRRRRTT